MKITGLALAIAAAVISSMTASAQKAIDDEVAKFESRSDVQVFYTEKRNTVTKKVYKESKTVILSNPDHVKRIKQAFQKERPNSSEATRSSKGIESMIFRAKNSKYEYNLVEKQEGGAVLSIEKREYDKYPKDSGDATTVYKFNDLTFSDFDGFPFSGESPFYEGFPFESSESLESLKLLDNIDWDEISDRIDKAVNRSESKSMSRRSNKSAKKGKKSSSTNTTTTVITTDAAGKTTVTTI